MKNRANVASALLSNTKDLEKAYKTALQAEGSALEENQKYMDSIQGRIDQFNNAIQTMWNNALNSDVIKFFVDIGTRLVQIIDTLGLMPSMLIAIGSYAGIQTLLNSFKASDITFKSILTSINSLTVGFKYNAAAQTAAKGAMAASTLANKLFRNSLVESLATQYLTTQSTKALEAAKYNLKLAEMGLMNGVATTTDVQAAQAAVQAASIPVDISKISTTELLGFAFKQLMASIWGATKAIVSFLLTNPIGWMVLFVGAVAGGVAIFNTFHKTTEELKEELADLKKELSDIQSELESTNSELETTRSRMAELLGMDQLSFTEKEELRNLQKQNDELQRKIDLLQLEEKYKMKQTAKGFVATMQSDIGDNDNDLFTHAPNLINRGKWLGTERGYINNEIDSYKKLKQQSDNLEQQMSVEEDDKNRKRIEKQKNKIDKTISEIESYIEEKRAEFREASDGVEYFTGDNLEDWQIESNEFLDYINNLDDKWAITLGGTNSKTNALTRIFNMDEFNDLYTSLENLQSKLRANPGDANIISEIEEKIKKSSIEDDLNKVDLEIQDAIDYWTMLGSQEDINMEVEVDYEKINDAIDSIQDAYSTLTDAVEQYNSTGYLTLDNLQALLSLEPEYLAVLQMENGQLSINQQAMETLLQTQLAKAEATVVDTAITQLNTLSERAKESAIIDSANAANNTIPVLSEYASQLSTVGEEAVIAAGKVSAFNAAVDGAVAAGVSADDVNTVISGMNAQLASIQSVRTNLQKNFSQIVSTGKSSGSGDTVLESLQKRYERHLKNLEAQQTQIENEIEILEAKEAGVSANYYDKQIELEEEKIGLYEKELEELKKLKRTDEVADALWEVEHAIQESTLRMIEFRKAIAELYATASTRISEAYDDLGQVYDDRKSYIENEISIRETKGELINTSVYDELIEQEKLARANAQAELDAQEDLYRQGMEADRESFEGSKEAIELLEKIRQKKLDIQESDKAIAEYVEQQKDAYIEYFDKMMEAYNHRNDLVQSQTDLAQSYIDRLETLNINIPDAAYNKLAEIQKLTNDGLKEQIEFAKSELANFEAQGIDKNDSRYIEKFKEVLDLEQQIYEGETKVLEYHQQIIDNRLDKFNQIIDRINNATSQLENVSGLISDDDVAEKDGSWTAEGITQLGMLYQQMEYNKQVAAEYAEEMKWLDEQFKTGKISEKEYTEQMQELRDGQWDAINAYKSAEDAIVDLNEARIDMVEDGINKEIEAYQELIDLKKKELDAERDLYDFRKDIQKQTKDIAALERRIASMSGSTDAATVAQRTKLEAELREAKEGLNDTYYNHAMDSQSNALDDELEAYEKSANNYIESLRESIKDTKIVVEKTFTDVLANADIVLREINRLSSEYGFTIEPNLKNPWINAAAQATAFKTTAQGIGSLINASGIITAFGSESTQKKLSGVFTAGSSAANKFAADVGTHIGTVNFTVNSATSPLTANLKAPWDNAGNDGNSGPLAFSNKTKTLMQGIVDYAKTNYSEQLKAQLDSPFNTTGYEAWGSGVTTMLQGKIREVEAAAKKIAEYTNPSTSSYVGNTNTGGNNDIQHGGLGGKFDDNSPYSGKFDQRIKDLQTVLVQGFNYPVGTNARGNYSYIPDGYWGAVTEASLKKAQARIGASQTGRFDEQTRKKLSAWLTEGYNRAQNTQPWEKALLALPKAAFAKGTLGTTRDQFAITDESWIGEEITLAAGKNGQLQYLKKGSSVMPADISANLVEWGKLNPNAMSIGNVGTNLNMISSAVIQPKLDFSFDSLVHVDHCDEGTLKDLEKMVDTKINQFSKQMNYAIKRFK